MRLCIIVRMVTTFRQLIFTMGRIVACILHTLLKHKDQIGRTPNMCALALQRNPQNSDRLTKCWLVFFTHQTESGQPIKTHFIPHYSLSQAYCFHPSTNEMINEPKINRPNYDKNDYDGPEIMSNQKITSTLAFVNCVLQTFLCVLMRPHRKL